MKKGYFGRNASGRAVRREKSCGAVVFTRDGGETRYVIVENLAGINYGLPKGHVEAGETEIETALREIKEETALDVRLVGDFRTETTYALGGGVLKTVVYFLAEYSGQTPRALEGEIGSVAVLTFDEAMRRLTYENARSVLRDAQEYLSYAGAI